MLRYEWYEHPRMPRQRVIDVPESGGCIIEFRDGRGNLSYVFTPKLEVWAQAFAEASGVKRPVLVGLDTDSATDEPQPRPEL